MIEAAVAEPLEAQERPEIHEAGRADVALLVASRADGGVAHARFADLGRFLRPGDLLVVNTSATLPAALPARLDGEDVLLHLSTPADGTGTGSSSCAPPSLMPLPAPRMGAVVELPGGATCQAAGALPRRAGACPWPGSRSASRSRATCAATGSRSAIATRRANGRSTSTRPSSRSIPAARRCRARRGRSRAELVAELARAACCSRRVTLHAGVSSLELGENPYPERYRVPARDRAARERRARLGRPGDRRGHHRRARARDGRRPCGARRAGEGLTNLVVTPERGLHAVDGLITGWHEPSRHTCACSRRPPGRDLLARSYDCGARRAATASTSSATAT